MLSAKISGFIAEGDLNKSGWRRNDTGFCVFAQNDGIGETLDSAQSLARFAEKGNK